MPGGCQCGRCVVEATCIDRIPVYLTVLSRGTVQYLKSVEGNSAAIVLIHTLKMESHHGYMCINCKKFHDKSNPW